MRGARPLVALLGTVLVFAGCNGPADDASQQNPGADTPTGAPDPFEAPPSWNVSDYWTYSFSIGASATSVVTQTGSDHLLRSDSDNVAFREVYNEYNDTYDVSHVGPVRASDLSGSQNGVAVQYFQWPVDPNATWSTQWDQRTVDIQVLEIGEDSVTFQGSVDGVVYVDYVYSASAQWFQSMQFYSPDGAPTFSMQLTDFGSGWSGRFPSWELEEIAQLSHHGGRTALTDTFEVPPEVTDVWLKLDASCTGTGRYDWATGPAQGLATDTEGGFAVQGDCPAQESFEGSIGAEPRQGWGYVFESSGDAFDLEAHILLRTQSFEDWPAS